MATRTDSDQRLSIGVTIIIVATWTISFLVDIVVKTYDPPYTVHLLMMAVAGAIFGGDLVKKRTNGQPPQEKTDE